MSDKKQLFLLRISLSFLNYEDYTTQTFSRFYETLSVSFTRLQMFSMFEVGESRSEKEKLLNYEN